MAKSSKFVVDGYAFTVQAARKQAAQGRCTTGLKNLIDVATAAGKHGIRGSEIGVPAAIKTFESSCFRDGTLGRPGRKRR